MTITKTIFLYFFSTYFILYQDPKNLLINLACTYQTTVKETNSDYKLGYLLDQNRRFMVFSTSVTIA